MSNPIVHAFFIGRALADTLYDHAELAFTDALSELGKQDAELREKLRNLSDRVVERAAQEEAAATQGRSSYSTASPFQSDDLQTVIDELRAEVARLRSELKQYRSRTS
ncbi:MAG: hypothetical protein DCF22_00110 [Leptolyngbya sp.]|nr:MAG: hypothetical protein DCF22_00110 [Leptolyngbya sp.]